MPLLHWRSLQLRGTIEDIPLRSVLASSSVDPKGVNDAQGGAVSAHSC